MISKGLLIIQTKISICYLLLDTESNFRMVIPKSKRSKLNYRIEFFLCL